ncbi:hypothetical protein ACC733_37215, partial [Rhizobium johnstonii]|uniref:hypothetical protein n=1 Tax=Rhizobium johnstonii TaxID=3019933 RepID=UPI003F995E7C
RNLDGCAAIRLPADTEELAPAPQCPVRLTRAMNWFLQGYDIGPVHENRPGTVRQLVELAGQ